MEDDEVERIGKEILKAYTSFHNGEYVAAWTYLEAAVKELKGAGYGMAASKTAKGAPEV